MSGWSWALLAMSGQCGTEMSLAALDVAAEVEKKTTVKIESSVVTEAVPVLVADDATPVLKAYYSAQPG